MTSLSTNSSTASQGNYPLASHNNQRPKTSRKRSIINASFFDPPSANSAPGSADSNPDTDFTDEERLGDDDAHRGSRDIDQGDGGFGVGVGGDHEGDHDDSCADDDESSTRSRSLPVMTNTASKKRFLRHGIPRATREELRSLTDPFSYAFYAEKRNQSPGPSPDHQRLEPLQDWRMRERLKTVSVALVLCLNIGVDPPDVVKTDPCAKLECWVDPAPLLPQKALEAIGKNLQQQYEVWQPRARYRLALDPSVEETKKVCTNLRRNAKDERILFHYNGHGVPKPTASGELWVFNKDYTQYIPVSLYDLQTWLGSPCIFVYDCSAAGHILLNFNKFAEQRDKERARSPHVEQQGSPSSSRQQRDPSSSDRASQKQQLHPEEQHQQQQRQPHDQQQKQQQQQQQQQQNPPPPQQKQPPQEQSQQPLTQQQQQGQQQTHVPPPQASDQRSQTQQQQKQQQQQQQQHQKQQQQQKQEHQSKQRQQPSSPTQNPATIPIPPKTTPSASLRDCIQLAACGPNETLPMNPDQPADMFTACLTTPIEIALRWFVLRNSMLNNITIDMVMKIPGRLNDRRTALGELNWIFTSITDTIAWNVLPQELFKRLFRQDLMVAALFRNFLLADRIMRSHQCTPMSNPALPPTHQHSMWNAWDLAMDMCLAQLPALLSDEKKYDEDGELVPRPTYRNSTFFAEQLTAFEVWLNTQGAVSRKAPEQLPIVLQVLLSQVHRLRALILLSKFLDLGPWAVNLALAVGIFPYVLKLLQSPAADLKPVLIFIWARILAVDPTCQSDLIKDDGYLYFTSVLAPDNGLPVEHLSEHRAMCAFILSIFCTKFPMGQQACLRSDVLQSCLSCLNDDDAAATPVLRQWVCLCLGKIWCDQRDAQRAAVRANAHDRLLDLLRDRVPEVRAAAVYALGTLVGADLDRTEPVAALEHAIALRFLQCTADGSPMVRREYVIALSNFVDRRPKEFVVVAFEFLEEERRQKTYTLDERKSKNLHGAAGLLPPEASSANTIHSSSSAIALGSSSVRDNVGGDGGPAGKSPGGRGLKDLLAQAQEEAGSNPTAIGMFNALVHQNVHACLWKCLLQLAVDPHHDVWSVSQIVVDDVVNQFLDSRLGEVALEKDLFGNAIQHRRVDGSGGAGHSAFGHRHDGPIALPDPAALMTVGSIAMSHGDAVSAAAAATASFSDHHLATQTLDRRTALRISSTLKRSPSLTFSLKNFYNLGSGGSSSHAAAPLTGAISPGVNGHLPSSSHYHGGASDYFNSGYAHHNPFPAPAPPHGPFPPHPTTNVNSHLQPPPPPSPFHPPQTPNHLSHQPYNPLQPPPPPPPPPAPPKTSFSTLLGRSASHSMLATAASLRAAASYSSSAYFGRHAAADNVSASSTSSLTTSSATANGGNGYPVIPADVPGGDSVLPLTSSLWEWSAERFAEPQMRPEEKDEPGSVQYNKREWRKSRNDRIFKENETFWKKAGVDSKWQTPPNVLNNGNEPALLLLQKYEPHLIVADDRCGISVWDWEGRENLNMFSNSNPFGTKITTLKFINEHDSPQLLVGSSEGIVRLYRHYESPNETQLVSAWRALPQLIPSTRRGSGLIAEWHQGKGELLVSGDVKTVKVWDAATELVSTEIPTRSGSCVTSLTSDPIGGDIFVAGFGDGAVRAYDKRNPPREAMVMAYKESPAWIVNVHMQLGGNRELVSASVSGDIKLWDIRERRSLWTIEGHQADLTALAVHDYAPVFVSGSGKQQIKIWNMQGQTLSTVGHYTGFLGQKISAVRSLAFHPHRLIMAAGGSDGYITIAKGTR